MRKTTNLIDVLVGEAKDGHADLTEATLRESGIVNNLYRARNGAEMFALTHFACRDCEDTTDAPLLILLDYGLPRGGGVGVLRALRCNQRFSWIPIIMMTAAYDHNQAEQCRRLGCESYIAKWAVFLGLAGFVRQLKGLADRAICGGSRGLVVPGRHGCRPGEPDRRSIPHATRSRQQRPERIGKEMKDDSATP